MPTNRTMPPTIEVLIDAVERMADLHALIVAPAGKATSAEVMARLRQQGKHAEADELATLVTLAQTRGAPTQ
jgi:hypothetical protein